MLKKITALLLALVMVLSLVACGEENQNEIIKKAISAIDNGDIETAYDLLYNIENRNYEADELFSKFAFVPIEIEDYGYGITKEYTYDSDGNLVSFHFADNSYSKTETYTYDENGKLISENDGEYNCIYEYDNDDNIISMSYEKYGQGQYIKGKFTFLYDENGNLIKKLSWSEKDEIKRIQNYKYDVHNNLIENYIETSYGGKEKTTLEYNNDQKLSKMSFLDMDKSYEEIYTFNYDDIGNLTTEHSTINDVWTNTKYTYDSNNNILICDITSSLGDEYWHKYVGTYNNNNHIKTRKYTNHLGTESANSYSHNYDNYGNIIKTTVNGDIDIVLAYKYKLTYFPNGIPKYVVHAINNFNIHHNLNITERNSNLFQLLHPYIYNTNDIINPSINPTI